MRSKSVVVTETWTLAGADESLCASGRRIGGARRGGVEADEEAEVSARPNIKGLVSPAALARGGSGRARGSSTVNSEYGLSHNAWLNFFEGMDVPLADVQAYREMSEEQRKLYREFRHEFRTELGACDKIDRMKPYTLPDDLSILRFLQADKYDFKLAMKRLIDTVVWRQQIDLPALVREQPETLEAYRRLRVRRFLGFDKAARPVFAERIGEFIGKLGSAEARTLSQRDYLLCYIYEMGQFVERFREAAATRGHTGWKQTFIADCKGMKFLSAVKSINLLKSFAKEVEVHFPEQAGPIFLINCPSVVTSVWKMVKQFLDPSVISKIQIHSGVPTDVMLELMGPDVLLEEYGGNNATEYPHVA